MRKQEREEKVALDYGVKIGLVPIRRDVALRPGVFNWEEAEERRALAVTYTEEHFSDGQVSFVDLKGINPVNVLYCEWDVDAVVGQVKQKRVDAILLINGNFDSEGVAVTMVRELGKLMLLWGLRDETLLAGGTRYTDSQCELFGTSRQLQRLNIPFTYIKNYRMEEDMSARGLRWFVSVACMMKNFRGMRITQVGM